MTQAGPPTLGPRPGPGPNATADPAAMHRQVDALLGASRWAEAAALLGRVPLQDVRTRLKLNLARNMGALQTHRPAVYSALRGAPVTGRYQLAVAADGKLSISSAQPGKAPVLLSDQAQPSKGLARLAAVVNDPANEYHVPAVLGVGDGYFLTWFAQNTRPDAIGMLLPVYFIEPDPELLYQALMIHDWSGPGGPIAQPRFIWAVGRDWDAALTRLIEAEPQLRLPSMQIEQPLVGTILAERVKALVQRQKDVQDAIRRRLAAYYEGHTREQLLDLLGLTPPRPPRILLLTSRFTTVVQYVMRDLAEALGRLGWQAQVLTDSAAHLVVGAPAVLRKLEEFKPDVALTINHVRNELDNVFPPNLPFVCWTQDHIRGLMDRSVGQALGPRDFIFAEAPDQYVERFGYPAQQCFALSKLAAAVEPLPAGPGTAPVDDLVYVSHASAQPERLYEDLCAKRRDQPEQQAILTRCGRRLLDLYAAGDCCATSGQMHALVEQTVAELGLPPREDAEREVLCQTLYVPLNNALYRQQALGWLADVADASGLRLGLYGKGWETHPKLGRFARGPMASGPDLQRLTARSRINFQIVPFAFYHQRLFEGLMAGGFFLIRRNAHDQRQAEQLRHQGLMTGEFPEIEEVCFDDRAGLERLITRFIAAPEERRRIAARQRAFVAKHFTYDGGARRMIDVIRQRIARTAI